MTVIEKLSDRGGYIIEVIHLILKNKKITKVPALQWELFERGIFVNMVLLEQAISVMKTKGLLMFEKK